MRVLILSCATGGGHNDAARGAAQALTAAGHEAVLLDHYLGMAGGAVDTAVCQGYVETVRHAPKAFRALYGIGRGASTGFYKLGVPSPVYWANIGLAGKLEALLAQEHFDAVVMTHLFPAQTLTYLRHKGAAVPLTVAVATDYTSIPFWEETDCDWYMVPDTDTAADFVRRGVPAAKLLPMGIPAPAAFDTGFDRAAVRAALGFAPDKKYILVMGGSMGAGDLPGLVRRLRREMGENCRLEVLTGTNRAMHETLSKAWAGDKAVCIHDKLGIAAPYMQAADLLFTKPGGLTSTECILSRVPTVLLDPLSQCEDANRAALTKHNCALAPKGTQARVYWGLRLMNSPAACARMRAAQAACLPQNPALALVDFLREQTGEKEASL